jgi:fumarate reductase subunit C
MGFIESLKRVLNQIYQDKTATFLILICTVISVLLFVLGTSPQEWGQKVEGWLNFLKINFLVIFLVVIILVLIIILIRMKKGFEGPYNVPIINYSDNDTFRSILKPLIIDNATIRLFSYSSETLSGFITWGDLRDKKIDLQILVRNWHEECDEEMKYNKSLVILGSKKREWKKAYEIYKQGLDRKNSVGAKGKIEVRYYSGYPKFKGIIIESQNIKYAFLGLYHWVESPNGGSQYIGDKGAVVFLRDDRGELEKILLDRFESQFKRMWNDDQTKDFADLVSKSIPFAPEKPCK